MRIFQLFNNFSTLFLSATRVDKNCILLEICNFEYFKKDNIEKFHLK